RLASRSITCTVRRTLDISLAPVSPARNRSRRFSWLDDVVVDVVPDDVVAEPRPLGQIDVAVGVKLVAGRSEIRVGRVIVDARRKQPLLVVLAGVLRGGAADLKIAPPRHVDLTAQPVSLADDGRLARSGDAPAHDVDAAHIGGATQDPF